ncbi:MAG: Acetyl-coenzyme A carboxylase carboxyl transferase subunit beta [Alphaproteobacteria bacterium MarineAlpha6_Bin4]|nr:MAG: Acetyl-coenzyme A carboxylase carboxyl transferase subunit beta [Alphaproteobacteria bacterium MarineAlpha6_Bin5]PPR37302.1 MAG: Acetyl-coenzyme A carboxylase carboxyl transferase subunit beta [Alphaproteobacteria bacterium MarineAlpha6_Bin4]|tara:strand:+ start:7032 stop:7880 length:849 start_codon:yes stop_codon:yes gene_type:complete
MNWLTNYIKPKLESLVKKRDVPKNLWIKCQCSTMIYYKDYEKSLGVCNECGTHMRLPAETRLKFLLDDNKYEKIKVPSTIVDPLSFKDKKRYKDRIKQAKRKTKEEDAVVIAEGKIEGKNVILAVFDFNFMGGSMGINVGNSILKASEISVKKNLPLIIIPSSGGARMQEGILSLMQMPRTIAAIQSVKKNKIPYIVVLADPTTGGVCASFAMLGDILIAEKGATIGFAGRRVIEQTIKETIPDNFQTSDYLLEHGMVDMVVHRKDLKNKIYKILKFLEKKN